MSDKLPSWKVIDADGKTCGCVVDAFRYLKICAKHQKIFDEVHEEWTADYKRIRKDIDSRQPDKTATI
jgi:hypothetical protein